MWTPRGVQFLNSPPEIGDSPLVQYSGSDGYTVDCVFCGHVGGCGKRLRRLERECFARGVIHSGMATSTLSLVDRKPDTCDSPSSLYLLGKFVLYDAILEFFCVDGKPLTTEGREFFFVFAHRSTHAEHGEVKIKLFECFYGVTDTAPPLAPRSSTTTACFFWFVYACEEACQTPGPTPVFLSSGRRALHFVPTTQCLLACAGPSFEGGVRCCG